MPRSCSTGATSSSTSTKRSKRYMGFQTQLFSDKSFYEHLVRSFRSPWSGNHEGKPMRGASQTPSIHNFKHSKGFNCHYTFGTGTVSLNWPPPKVRLGTPTTQFCSICGRD